MGIATAAGISANVTASWPCSSVVVTVVVVAAAATGSVGAVTLD